MLWAYLDISDICTGRHRISRRAQKHGRICALSKNTCAMRGEGPLFHLVPKLVKRGAKFTQIR